MTKFEYRSSRNVVYSSKYHLVWCPKYRPKLLVAAVQARLSKILRQVCAEHQVEIIDCEIMDDHVHLLVEVDPTLRLPVVKRYAKNQKVA